MRHHRIACLLLACLSGPVFAQAPEAQTLGKQTPDAPIPVVAAENFYGDLARQLGGNLVRVTSILNNPDDDPHLFEATPSGARALAGARIAIENGVDYDPWMDKLLAATAVPGRRVIDAALLVGAAPGANPHLWYASATMASVARSLADALGACDPRHRAAYAHGLQAFIASLQPLDRKVAAMRTKYAGLPVTATEPVFGYMAAAIGLLVRNQRFQLAVMNNAEPRASDVAAFEDDLRERRVRVLLYNTQATDDAARRLLRLARQAGIPVVGISETEPAGATYQRWMLDQLDALDHALSAPPA